MSTSLLLLLSLLSPATDLIEVDAVADHDAVLHVSAHTVAVTAPCPCCGIVSARIHSRYTRILADLPCCATPIILSLQVRRFFCDVSACSRRTFAERLPMVAPSYARRTSRLTAALVPIAFIVGGNPGAALTRAAGIAVSRQTLLRLIRRTPAVERSRPAPQIVGIDDWAWKRGHRYGTIVCDLEEGYPLDLLPDRDATSATEWLKQHPTITVVSRDRGGLYADAANQGAPHAIQVADRWHLLKNLGDALELFLRRERVHLRPVEPVEPAVALPSTSPSRESTAPGEMCLPEGVLEGVPEGVDTDGEPELPSLRAQRFAQVHARRQAGASIQAIAREFGLARNTVRHYLRSTHVPDWRRGTRRSHLDPYREYLLERWNAGCHNGRQLFREIRERGYGGGVSQVGVLIARWREQLPSGKPLVLTPQPPSPRTLRWLLTRHADELDDDQRCQVQTVLASAPRVATAHDLVQRFTQLVRERQGDALPAWMERASASDIQELQGFVYGLRRDLTAVQAGLTLKWSNGPVEGQITRVKLLKRQMYGRAHLDLLRQRVLYRVA